MHADMWCGPAWPHPWRAHSEAEKSRNEPVETPEPGVSLASQAERRAVLAATMGLDPLSPPIGEQIYYTNKKPNILYIIDYI